MEESEDTIQIKVPAIHLYSVKMIYGIMTRLEKVEGKKENCPVCGDAMICVNKPYQGKDKLQWQNLNGTAHYNFNFQDKSTSCNRVGTDSVETSTKTTDSSPKTTTTMSSTESIMEFILNYEFKMLKEPEQKVVENFAIKEFEEKLIITKVAIEKFSAVGFDNVASIGQILTLRKQ